LAERKDENVLKIRNVLAAVVFGMILAQALLPHIAQAATPVTFPAPNLEAAVPVAIDKASGNIYVKNVQSIAGLDAGGIRVTVDGQALFFDVAPVNENGRVMVPMRAIFEALGAEIQWNGATNTVTATKDATAILLTLGKQTATVNGETVSLAAPAKLINERTFVPLRFVAEALGSEVNWDAGTKLVSIASAPTPQATTPSIRIAKDEGNRMAYYINGKLAAEVEVGSNGVRGSVYSGDGWSIAIKYGNFAGPLTYEPVWYQCFNGSTDGPVYFPTNEWRTDPKIRQDQKDAIEFVLEELEERNRKIRP
jgi:hypothetical protein